MSAVKYFHMAAEEPVVMNMAGTGAAHAGRVGQMVSDLRLVDEILNVMAWKPHRVTREEQWRHVNTRTRPRNTAPNPNDEDYDDDDQPRHSRCQHLISAAQDARRNSSDDGDNGSNGDDSGNEGGQNDGRGNEGNAGGDGDENENENGDNDGSQDRGQNRGECGDGRSDDYVEGLSGGCRGPSSTYGQIQGTSNNTRGPTTGTRTINTTPLRPTCKRGCSAGEYWSGSWSGHL
ncbi:hypothetical protein HOY80DRAFT_1078947 [Tuber brumale]|nr:hypothetical protein HOY80DRAFT_1078947 [Tuber brumale]